MPDNSYAVPPPGERPRQITPTDVAQFIRLDQCERYLRLALHRRNGGSTFMRDYGVVPQSIPPLLTRSGSEFERAVERAVRRQFWAINFVEDQAHAGNRPDDNARVARLARDLAAGEVAVLFQPRLSAVLGTWRIRGDADIIRLERDTAGQLRALIVDMKSTAAAKVEHRLQVAFYLEMLSVILAGEGIECDAIDIGILYRGPDETDLGADEWLRREEQRTLAEELFGVADALLEIVPDPESYSGSVRELVTDPDSTAARIAAAPFSAVPFTLDYKCDGCVFNEFCMRWTAEQDDLSLLPYMTGEDKAVLRRNAVTTTSELASLKDFRLAEAPPGRIQLVPAPGKESQVHALAASWPVGPRLDELIMRARRYRAWRHDPIEFLPYIPSKGYGSLPYCDANQNPNLVRVYIDAQHDYLHDRIYMLGSLIVASEGGAERPGGRRTITRLTPGSPNSVEKERDLVLGWVGATLVAIGEVAAPDAEGEPRAPIHLIFFNRFAQQVLLEALARHFDEVLGATPLYDFVTQLAAFDSPVASFLDAEMRELKNYPMVCQSLQTVAAFLRFDWNSPEPCREIFRTRMFDFWGKLKPPRNEEGSWYTSRARFNSQIPLEYAYAAWQELEEPHPGGRDDFASYRAATPDLLLGFHARRLEAMEHVAADFTGNRFTEKTSFDLSALRAFDEKAPTLARALDEFVTIEQHVELADWKSARLAPPERRVLSGITLIARYFEEDQPPDVRDRNRHNLVLWQRREEYKRQARAAGPFAPEPKLTPEQKGETKWDQAGLCIRLRLEASGCDCDLDEMLALSQLKPGDRLVVLRRFIPDSRLPVSQQVPITPTPKRMLYGTRADFGNLTVERTPAGRARFAWIDIELATAHGGAWSGGFAFGAIEEPFFQGELYTLDADPNNFYGYFCSKVTQGLSDGRANALYSRLVAPDTVTADWPDAAAAAQDYFLQGLDALQEAGALTPFEQGKRLYIGRYGDAPTLLVQGPPGTGKSFSTAFAVFARLQGAMAAGRPFRVFAGCKTHAATDVLLREMIHVQQRLREFRRTHPALFTSYFDARLLDVPLFRMQSNAEPCDGAVPLSKKDGRPPGEPDPVDAILAQRWCVVGTTPGGVYRMLKDRYNDLFGHDLCDCLVLDEASQLNLPEAIMAALALGESGQLIVVGDHRQMPPIVKHDWAAEPRRTFAEFRAYESLFAALLPLQPPMIKFQESFRLHADMAEFLRREIYRHDGIQYFSRRTERLAPIEHPDDFVAAVLAPHHPLVVVVHDEAESLARNPFEQDLITPVLEALADPNYLALNPEHGLGVVVPRTAQRAALREGLPLLTVVDPATGAPRSSAVDTVERFQGSERTAIVISTTESDPQYVLTSSEFLLDPRRLTVALSRAKCKLILVASRSIFNLFSADEETFANAQLWKNLLRSTCTVPLWSGTRAGHTIHVWGNEPHMRELPSPPGPVSRPR